VPSGSFTCAYRCCQNAFHGGVWAVAPMLSSSECARRGEGRKEGGFVYDSESYNDDIPYWTNVDGKAHLVVPYSLVVNDCRFVLSQGYSNPNDLYDFAKASLDRRRNDGDDTARMMSVGLHCRFSGNPAGADAVARFIGYARRFDDVWIARRIDITRSFIEQVRAEATQIEAQAVN
jgi:hypothetical protein